MNTLSKIGLLAIVVVICGLFIFAAQDPTKKILQTNTTVQTDSTFADNGMMKVKAIELPKSMSFAGERVPLEDTDVRERLDREIHVNTYWQSNMLLMIKKANRFFSEIEPLLAQYGYFSQK